MTALIRPATAEAYVNHGRWVADCPMQCGGALKLDPRQGVFHCPECKTMHSVTWPTDPDEIMEALERRVVPRTRNWFPRDHYLAVRAHAPHGQTIKELDDETAEHGG